MDFLEKIIVIGYAILAFISFIKGFFEIKFKKNPFGLANIFSFLGIFVWGDAFVLSPFWMIVSIGSFIVRSWYLFLLVIALFWVVRSLGEVIYWLHEQFAAKNRNLPHTLRFHAIFQSSSVWFVYQLFWQCVLVLSLLASIYLSKVWVSGKI